MIDPGRLNTRLRIEAPDERDDGQGGVLRSFVPQAVVWALVRPLRGRPAIAADAAGAVVPVRIVVRNAVALTLQHRLVDGARIYRIVALREAGDRRLLEIDTELRLT